MTTTTLTRPATLTPCKCGTRSAPQRITRNMGRAKSWRMKCPGCGKESAPTFYLERLDDRWNEVAGK